MSAVTAVTPKERPILFSGPMVRAIVAGQKTQTRRIINPQPTSTPHPRGECFSWKREDGKRIPNGPRSAGGGAAVSITELIGRNCPYGAPGDRLWTRETLRRDPDRAWTYAADDEPVTVAVDAPGRAAMVAWAHHKDGDVCVSIHMPRWASRITLDVTDVRVERLQTITEADAIAEGMLREEVCPGGFDPDNFHPPGAYGYVTGFDLFPSGTIYTSARDAYSAGWDAINGKRPGCSWESNPWVWVVSFQRQGGLQ